jgi:hypothetical protein
MPRTQEKHPRASNGRFVKRTRRVSKDPASPEARGAAPGGAASDRSDVTRHGPSARRQGRDGSVRLALLTLAILFAALGFALSFFWIAALVLMAALWGVMIAERPQRQETVKGLVTEMVTAVVDEAKDVRDATAASVSASDAAVQPPANDEARQTES